jgi:hypothetical protein
MAAEAGTDYSGVLCGRATWKDGIPIYGKQGREGAGGLAFDRGREEYRSGECGDQAGEAVVARRRACRSRSTLSWRSRDMGGRRGRGRPPHRLQRSPHFSF